MGLDMYLNRRSYVENWDHMKAEYLHEITIKRGGKIREDIDPKRISYIEEQVAYWRKANSIHNWFVEHVQDGEDDCGTYNVSTEQLKELVDACNQVLNTVETVEGDVHTGTIYTPDGGIVHETEKGEVVAQPKIAESVLPTKSGFFFGSTSYDKYYLEDLRETVKMLTPLLEDEEGEYTYHSSW